MGNRVLAVILSLLLLFSLIHVGRNLVSGKEDRTLTVLVPYGTQYNAQKSRLHKFTEKTGIKVKYVFVPYGNLLDKITAEGVARTDFYDVVTFQDSWGPSITQFLLPIDKMLTKDDIHMKRYPNAYQEGSTFNEKVYGLPVRGHPQMLFYRKDVFEKLNLQAPTTWKKLEETAAIIEDKTDLYGISMYYGKGNGGQNLYLWVDYLWGNGGDIFNDKGKPIFNNSAGVEATKRYVDLLLNKKVAAPGSVSANEPDSAISMARGSSAMWIGWWWNYTVLNKENAAKEVAGNIAFAPVPKWEGKEAATYAISLPAGIMKSSKKKEEAWEYLKWVSSQEVEQEIVKDSYEGKNPENEFDIVMTQSKSLKDPEINAFSNGLHQEASKSLEASKTLPLIKAWPEISEILSSAISKMASGAPVEETLNEAAFSVEKVMVKSGNYKQ
ncbi:ABC transporter substrate-binding protein [Peribacillus muralis]|uniref:ABC transporter substrate-binding protein n=1 Tax=Peribacillus muralis TaxID=264697 RepID=UPI00367072E8